MIVTARQTPNDCRYAEWSTTSGKKCSQGLPSNQLHKSLELDILEIVRIKSTLKIVYRGVHSPGSPDLNFMFEIYKPTRPLRSDTKSLLLQPQTKTLFAQNDIATRGSKYWNFTNQGLKETPTLDQYKLRLKKYSSLY